ncbi:Imm52 family immunity protein [Variovorax sp. WS11]|uniref:Imm52 family immunity protein n=1 Tax=Variovorax sp. WS11 TaxID=1105204 RepID=UPI0011B20F1A|nr:Imm52 family immunity protein [Variovorax sp. WS11]NDZ14829.1 hypothetical protein [Variovorax sp. WS11]
MTEGKQMESFFACAYWGARREELTACVARTQQCLASLAQVSDDFSTWRAKGMTRKAALSNPPITSESLDVLKELFVKGLNHKDIGGEVIEHLGFEMGIWNGLSAHRVASLGICCGMHSTVSGLSNSVVLSLPMSFDVSSTEAVAKLMVALVGPWDPEWAVVFSRVARDAQQEHGPFLDRALYVRSGVELPPDLPLNAVARDLERGRLVMPAALT